MDSPCIKQTVCKVLNIFQHGKYLVAYVLNLIGVTISIAFDIWEFNIMHMEKTDMGFNLFLPVYIKLVCFIIGVYRH